MAGDVNGDGFQDMILAGVGGLHNDYDGGNAYLVFGKASGFGAHVDLASLTSADGVNIVSSEFATSGYKFIVPYRDQAGWSISAAGDINGDGFGDVIIGAPSTDTGLTHYTGASYVVFGKATGFPTQFDLFTMSAAEGFRIDGLLANYTSGEAVASAGDFNGDGIADLIVADNNATHIVFGSTVPFPSRFDLASLNGSNGFNIQGGTGYLLSGSVASAGDVNGDGLDDVIIGLPDLTLHQLDAAYVVFGRPQGVTGDIDLSSLDGTNGFKISGGGRAISSAGDINGDGLADVIVDGAVVYGQLPGAAVTRIGTAASQSLVGGDFGDLLSGMNGDDRLYGHGGDDTLDGGAGTDVAVYYGTAASYLVSTSGSGVTTVQDLRSGSPDGTDALTNVEFLRFTDQTVQLHAIPTYPPLTLTASAPSNGLVEPGYYQVPGVVTSTVKLTPMGGEGGSISLDGWTPNSGGLYFLAGTYGDVELDPATNTLTYILNGLHPLALGQVVSDQFTITATDGSQFASTSVSFSVTGSADSILDLNNTLPASQGFVLHGGTAVERAGQSVASAGDINGDGYADMVVGTAAGVAYVVFGKAAPFTDIALPSLNGTNGFKLSAPGVGFSVSPAGDVNGDGTGDVFIGAPLADPHGTGSGAGYVVFGKTTGFAPNFDLTTLDGSNGFKVSGEAANDAAGGVASADVNGDGISDLIIGASGADPHGEASGAAYVVFGTTAGYPANIDLSNLNGSNGFKLNGEAAYDAAGTSVASAGDVNGDGFEDIFIGAPFAIAPDGLHSGAGYVVYGHAGGFAPSVDLSSLNGSNGFRVSGGGGLDYAGGFSVSSAGDVNGDGYADMIIGARGANAAYVVFGKPSGFGANVDLQSLDGTNGFRMPGPSPYSYAGYAVSSAGDVNGDGFDDLIVSALFTAAAGLPVLRSETYLVFGKASGFTAVVYPNGVDSLGTNGRVLTGDGDFGNSVASAGDINGDGLDDLIVGAPDASNYGSDAIVIYGQMPGEPVTRVGTAASQRLVGGNFGDGLSALGGDDRLYGHGGDDTLDGGTGDDTAVYYGPLSSYLVSTDPSGVTTVQDLRAGSPDGTDTLTNIEHLQFADQTVATPPAAPIDQPPATVGDNLTTPFGRVVTVSAVSLLANDTDPDGDVLSLTAVGGAQHGTVSLSGGSVTFTPFVGYVGAAGFSYTVDDGNGGTATGQVTVDVTGNSPAYIYRGSITTPETVDFTGDSKSHQVLVGSGDTTVLMGSGGGSAHLGAGNDVVIGGNGKDSITFGPGLGTATGGAGPDAFIFVKGQIADPSLHGGQYDTVTDFVGAGGWVPGRDFIWLQGFSHSSSVTYEGDLSSDPTAHLYRVDDGAYHAEFVLQYAGPGVALAYGQYGIL